MHTITLHHLRIRSLLLLGWMSVSLLGCPPNDAPFTPSPTPDSITPTPVHSTPTPTPTPTPWAEQTWYLDLDGDGFGNDGSTVQGCTQPELSTDQAGDCDAHNNRISPVAPETCNGLDDNCSGEADEGLALSFYLDADADGFGDPEHSELSCSEPEGHTANALDCNDGDKEVYPGAPETCNGLDDKCSGSADEGLLLIVYQDNDGDGFGSTQTTSACSAPDGYALEPGDCNDNDADLNPTAASRTRRNLPTRGLRQVRQAGGGEGGLRGPGQEAE